MISRLSGELVEKKPDILVVKVSGIFYEVLMPKAVMKAVDSEYKQGDIIELVTYHYFHMETAKAVPVLIGFQNTVEKEFFEKFISVSGIGPKAACRALSEPFSVTAGAIDCGDTVFLKKLPGIGERKAAEIVARLKGKVGKYGLIKDEYVGSIETHEDIRNEAVEILLQLQYKKTEAQDMVSRAFKRNPGVRSSEELLNEVYRDRAVGAV